MKTETIQVPHFEGYKCVGYGKPETGQHYYLGRSLYLAECDFLGSNFLIYEKEKPKRYIFEETGEYRRVNYGDYYFDSHGDILQWVGNTPSNSSYKILRKIEEE